MNERTPRQIVRDLDRYIIGQNTAKRAVAIAIRNRWRRLQVNPDFRSEIMPGNIIMIGPTGVGKTEMARRLAELTQAPFVKVEASRFTEVGYVGRDVESMIRELVDHAVGRVREREIATLHNRITDAALDRIQSLVRPLGYDVRDPEDLRSQLENNPIFAALEVDLLVTEQQPSYMQVFASGGMEELGMNLQEILGDVPLRSHPRRVMVGEAWRILQGEEAEKLLDRERIVEEALAITQENGIVFIDEIDKVIAAEGEGPDVSRSGVQKDILPLVEGTTVKTRHGTVRTDHILFIAAGAFSSSSPSDLIPELQGRFPIRVELDSLGYKEFVRILQKPENALIKQYQALLASENVKLMFDADAIRAIARIAAQVNSAMDNIGARRLQTLMALVLEDWLFNLPDQKTREIQITAKQVEDKLRDIIENEDLSRFIL